MFEIATKLTSKQKKKKKNKLLNDQHDEMASH